MLSPEYVDKDVDYPDGFAQVKAYDKPYDDASNLPYYPKEGEGNLIQRNNLYNNIYVPVLLCHL